MAEKQEEGTTARVSTLPNCSFCDEKAEYDFRTVDGRWAFGCQEHYKQHRMHDVLGLGMGQLLISDLMAAAENRGGELDG